MVAPSIQTAAIAVREGRKACVCGCVRGEGRRGQRLSTAAAAAAGFLPFFFYENVIK